MVSLFICVSEREREKERERELERNHREWSGKEKGV